jgi:hypothetical protein
MIPTLLNLATQFAAADRGCGKADAPFFGFPTWYKYVPTTSVGNGPCTINIDFSKNPQDAWLIGLGVADILLRVAALVAIGYVVYGGVQYITSQGQPDATSKARQTIINALIGLVIAISASATVTFIAGRFT